MPAIQDINFWMLLAGCCFISRAIIGRYETMERAARRRITIKVPFWTYRHRGRHFFYVLGDDREAAIEILLSQSTFEKVSEAEQDFI